MTRTRGHRHAQALGPPPQLGLPDSHLGQHRCTNRRQHVLDGKKLVLIAQPGRLRLTSGHEYLRRLCIRVAALTHRRTMRRSPVRGSHSGTLSDTLLTASCALRWMRDGGSAQQDWTCIEGSHGVRPEAAIERVRALVTARAAASSQHALLLVQETLKREQVSDGRHSPFSKVSRISRQGQR